MEEFEKPRFVVRRIQNGRKGYEVVSSYALCDRISSNFIFSCYYKHVDDKFVVVEENKVHQRHGKVLEDVNDEDKALNECYERALHFAIERVKKRRAIGLEVELGEVH